MTPDDFRKIALNLPEAVESSHMHHPDFRVGGKIFATLGYPDKNWAVVKLTPDEQRHFVGADPDAFQRVKGACGRQGNTNVLLEAADTNTVRAAVAAAWRNTAPKGLVRRSTIGGLTKLSS